MTQPRFPSITGNKQSASFQNAENARDVASMRSELVRGRLVTIENYAALGDTTSKVPIRDGAVRPKAVILARAAKSLDPGSDIPAVGRANFYHDARGIGVYEPSGLVLNTKYDLTFLVLE